jgi:DNA-binding SARP family transcriptional activator
MDVVPIRLLGPVAVVAGGGLESVRGRSARTVLAVLSLRPGQVVSQDQLIDALWPERPPATAANTLQRHVSSLRGQLPPAVTVTARAPGYVLSTDEPTAVSDVLQAQRLLARARLCEDDDERVATLQRSLDLWRGDSLADVASSPYLMGQAERLARLRTEVRRELVRARLASGEGATVVTDLEDLVGDEPYDEELHRELMLALYRAGRQVDALTVARELRRRLADQVGIDPGPALADLETAILRQEVGLDGGQRADPRDPGPTRPVPGQLPAAVPGFTGRRRELADLDAQLQPASGPRGAAVVVSAVSGTAGIGKTAIAVHWAHLVADRFPDGQLYANLRGFDPQWPPLEPGSVLRRFLEALGTSAARIPEDLDARSALFRSLLSDRRLLLLLDNARDAEQVRPLLPGSAGCLAIVTSRNRLASLAALEGAHLLPLDLLGQGEARELLARRLGRDRVETDEDAVDTILSRCGGLPLALAVVAGRAAARPYLPLDAVAWELSTARSALDALRGDDSATDVRAVFSSSYEALSGEAAGVFRLVGLHPGPDVSAAAVTSVAALSPVVTAEALAELVRASLLTETAPGRHACHDLVRAYALDRLEASQDDVHLARRRLLDHYLGTAHAATLLMGPLMESITLSEPAPGVVLEPLPDLAHAVAWFEAEHQALIGLVDDAAEHGFPRHAWQLAWCFDTHLHRAGHWADQVRIHTVSIAAARGSGDTRGVASGARALARARRELGEGSAAEQAAEEARGAFLALGEVVQAAYCDSFLGVVVGDQGRSRESMAHYRRALKAFQAAGETYGLAIVLNNLASCYCQRHDLARAWDYARRALAATDALGDQEGAIDGWRTLAEIHDRRHETGPALDCLLTAATLAEKVGNRYKRATSLCAAGDLHLKQERAIDAELCWLDALAILVDLDHPDAVEVRQRLAALA